MRFEVILTVAALFVLGCMIGVLLERSTRDSPPQDGPTTIWMNEASPPQTGDMFSTIEYHFCFAKTNLIELGMRSDGVIVWRKAQ